METVVDIATIAVEAAGATTAGALGRLEAAGGGATVAVILGAFGGGAVMARAFSGASVSVGTAGGFSSSSSMPTLEKV